MYDRYKNISTLEEQLRVYPSQDWYTIVKWLLKIDNDDILDNSKWIELEKYKVPTLEAVELFIDSPSMQSIY